MTESNDRIYLKFNYPEAVSGSKTLLTGIRRKGKVLYITGFYEPPNSETISFFYKGDLSGSVNPCSENSWNILNYPKSTATNLYGPLVLDCDNIRAVGNYTTKGVSGPIGCMYEGELN